MKFGRIALAEGEGSILAHSVRGPGVALKKGEVIRPAHIEALETAGIDAIVAATLEPGDVPENVAAERLAEAIAGAHVRRERPFTGRCNLMAEADGLLLVDAATVDRINLVDESITVATLKPMQPVVAGEMIATVKIIPFAVPEPCLARSLAEAAVPPVAVAPFRPLAVGVVSTLLPGLKPTTIVKTLRLLEDRLALAGARITRESRVTHEPGKLAASLAAMSDVDIIVIFGASAITDRRDVIPAAIEAAGGRVEHLGMPVDPGNLLLLGHLGPDGAVPVVGAPGCARSPKENGFDFVLWRLLAGLPVVGADLRRMGVGGLLSEIVARPQSRVSPEGDLSAMAKVAAIILAAGRGTRFGGSDESKVAAPLSGRPLVRHVSETALASRASSVVVVTGHAAAAATAALAGLEVTHVHNPDFATGMASSLKAGIAALPANAEGALILLADMPRVASATLDALIAAFEASTEPPDAVIPTIGGHPGNPVLIGARLFEAVARLEGDQGARRLLGETGRVVMRHEVDDQGIAIDVDTRAALQALGDRAEAILLPLAGEEKGRVATSA